MNRITYRRDLKKSIKVLVYSFSICEQVFFKQQRQKLSWQLFIFPWHLQPENFCKLSSELSELSAAPQPQPFLSASELRILSRVSQFSPKQRNACYLKSPNPQAVYIDRNTENNMIHQLDNTSVDVMSHTFNGTAVFLAHKSWSRIPNH